jgi:hypothetical protein
VQCGAVKSGEGGARGEEQPAGSGKDRIDCSIPRSGEGSKEGRLVEERRCGMLGEEVLVLACACLCLLVLACACLCLCLCLCLEVWVLAFQWRATDADSTHSLTHSTQSRCSKGDEERSGLGAIWMKRDRGRED